MDYSDEIVALFNASADRYAKKFMDDPQYLDSLDRYCACFADPNPRILEVACGPGNITQHIARSRPDFDILATDLAENMLQLARNHVPSAQFQLMDIRAVGSLGDTFSGIICGFGLPYLNDVEVRSFFMDAFEKLNSPGFLYVSTMEAPFFSVARQVSSSGDGPSLLTYYHDANSLVSELENAGFSIVNLERFPLPDSALPATHDLVIIAKKPA